MESSYYFLIQVSFALVTMFFVGWFLKEIMDGINASKLESKLRLRIWIIVGIGLWLIFICVISLSGLTQSFSAFPPPIAIVLIIPLASILTITFSSTLKKILEQIPSRNLIRLQVFRVFVEILLWMLFIEKLLPVQMTFEGRNFDVLAGISAPFIAYLFNKNKMVMIIWNFLGLGLLFNILTIAVLSMPTPIRIFMNEPANTIVTYFPIIVLPAFLVPLAYTLHFLSLRKLMIK